MITFLWRLIRPHVYSISDYTRLTERDPEELTMREVVNLQQLAASAEAFADES